MTPTVAIVGGGPCGLILARLLESKGIDYVVYERSEADCSQQGGSLDLHAETGQRALREADLFGQFRKHARYVDQRFQVFDHQGKECFLMGESHDAPEIDRSALRQILVGSIPKHRILWEHTLQKISSDSDCNPILHFTNGSTASGFQLVVGADGAWSKVRPSITQVAPQYSGKHYIEFKLSPGRPGYESIADKAGPGTTIWMGPQKYVGAQRQGDLSYRLYLAITVAEDFVQRAGLNPSDAEATRRLFLDPDFFGDWAGEVKHFIQNAEEFRSWPLYHIPIDVMGWESVPGLTLIGDAAHLALPNGKGVNIGMEDSLILASSIEAHGLDDLQVAVKEFEKDMFRRAKEHIADGMTTVELMFHEDSPATFLQSLQGGDSMD